MQCDLTVAKLKCVWNKYITCENLKIACSSRIHKTIHHNEVDYFYLEREDYKVLGFHVNNFCDFEISASLFYSLFKRRPPRS